MKRELAAAVVIPLILAGLFLAPPVLCHVVVGAIALAALWEFYRLAEKTGLPVAKTVGLAGGLAALSLPMLRDAPSAATIGIALLLLAGIASLAPLFAGVEPASALAGASGTVFGVLSVALPATALGYLRLISPRAVLFLFLIVWGCDSFAYYIGKNFGRRKLAPRVSPNKTWEGTFGGLVGGTLIGAAGGTWWLVPELGPVAGAAAGALASSAGQLGDLVESLWKRGAGVKDSGTFLPGHGGFYDRIDSLLFAGPVLLLVIGYFL